MAEDNASPPLEMDHEEHDEEDERAWRRRRMYKDPAIVRKQVLRRYYVLSTTAIVLTLTCPDVTPRPGNTLVLILVYLTTLFFLTWRLQGSDPGYLTLSILHALDEQEEQQNEPQPFNHDCKHGVEESQEVIESNSNHSDNEESLSSPRLVSSRENQQRLGLLQHDDNRPRQFPTRNRRPPCRHCPSDYPPPPLRSYHCHKCQQHVATFDHHCDFIGTCVGEANHARFVVFLTLQAMGLGMCAWMVSQPPYSIFSFLFPITSAASHHVSSTITILHVLICRFFVYPCTLSASVMWVFHTYLLCTHGTTLEIAKGPATLEYLNPQTRVCCDAPFYDQSKNPPPSWWKKNGGGQWRPTLWHRPSPIVRDSEKWWEHPWQNKYWTCC